jgi:cell division transport system permease protein
VFTSAAMAFLAVFALALSLASGRLADRWSRRWRNPRPSASRPRPPQIGRRWAVLAVLEQTPGVESARA